MKIRIQEEQETEEGGSNIDEYRILVVMESVIKLYVFNFLGK